MPVCINKLKQGFQNENKIIFTQFIKFENRFQTLRIPSERQNCMHAELGGTTFTNSDPYCKIKRKEYQWKFYNSIYLYKGW